MALKRLGELQVWDVVNTYDPVAGAFKQSVQLSSYLVPTSPCAWRTTRVLLAGGDSSSIVPSAAAELIAADGTSIAAVADMTDPRRAFQATLLNNGLVLLTGGGGQARRSPAPRYTIPPRAVS